MLKLEHEGDHYKMYYHCFLTRDPVFFLTNIVVIMFVLGTWVSVLTEILGRMVSNLLPRKRASVLAAFSVVGVPYEDIADRMVCV